MVGGSLRHRARRSDLRERTLHALDKARQLGFTRSDVEVAVLSGHGERRRNPGKAGWLVAGGRIVIAYEHPDGDDPLIARVVTVWRR